jgi:hypothetical protein
LATQHVHVGTPQSELWNCGQGVVDVVDKALEQFVIAWFDLHFHIELNVDITFMDAIASKHN